MRLDAVREHITLRMAQSYYLPDNSDLLNALIHEALVYTARACEPTILIRADGSEHFEEGVLRLLPNNKHIIFPEKPDSPDKHIMIDEELSFAIINYVCFLLSKNPLYLELFKRDILLYIKNDYEVS